MLGGLLRGIARLARRVIGVFRRAPSDAPRPRPGDVVAGLGVATFGALGWLVGSGAAAGLDLVASSAVQAMESELLTVGMQGISAVGAWPASLLVLAGAPTLVWRLGGGLAASFAALGSVGALLGASLLKLLWLRPRPTDEVLEVVGGTPDGSSFPSGHTLLYVTSFGFLFYWSARSLRPGRLRSALLWTCGALIGLIGISRVYLGHHWATDVLAAYALGAAWLLLLIRLYTARLAGATTA